MEYMFLPLKRYADFSGRSRRQEYWMFALGYIILFAILGGILMSTFDFAGESLGNSPVAVIVIALMGLIALGLFIPALAVQVRRFHDQDKSGWFVLLGFVPYVGGIIVLVFMCLEGTRGPNRFGPDPKETNADVASIFS